MANVLRALTISAGGNTCFTAPKALARRVGGVLVAASTGPALLDADQEGIARDYSVPNQDGGLSGHTTVFFTAP